MEEPFGICLVYIGSSANPGFRDFAIAATIVRCHEVHDRVSFDINLSSGHILQTLAEKGYLTELVAAGGRAHQPGCNGGIGMGQAPATDRISLRTVPRNLPGRSGTREHSVYLCSPETATASALKAVITDPPDSSMSYERIKKPERFSTSNKHYSATNGRQALNGRHQPLTLSVKPQP